MLTIRLYYILYLKPLKFVNNSLLLSYINIFFRNYTFLYTNNLSIKSSFDEKNRVFRVHLMPLNAPAPTGFGEYSDVYEKNR
jgi:hypothetical protein